MGLDSDDFRAGGEFTVGIEEELLLVDPRTHRLTAASDDVLARIDAPPDMASHELYAAEIELRSRPRAGVDAAIDDLANLRRKAIAAGAQPVGVGLHPDGVLGDCPHTDHPRFAAIAGVLRGLACRTPDAALHIHIGMPDAETAVRVANGLRRHLPLILALAANSPYCHGTDSGFASARAMLTRSHPRRGIPPYFQDFGHYRETTVDLLASAAVADASCIWWDIRLRPDLGTVEVREMDSQATLESAAGLAALVQALAQAAAEESGVPSPSRDALAESSFRAARDGLRSTILHGGDLRPVAEAARETLALAHPHARALGADGALEGIYRVLRDGGAADRQRAILRRRGMGALLASLVRDTTESCSTAALPAHRGSGLGLSRPELPFG